MTPAAGLQPRPGEVDAILRRSRHRRLHHAAGTAAAVTLFTVAVAYGAPLGGRAAGQRIDVTIAPEPSGPVLPGDVRGVLDAGPATAPGGTTPEPRAGRATGGPPSGGAGTAVTPARARAAGTAAPAVRNPMDARHSARLLACTPSGVAPFCTDLRIGGWTKAGRMFTAYACRNPGSTDDRLTFPGGLQADYTVSLDGREVWRWSRGQRFGSEPTSVGFAPGQCFAWSTRWPGVDESGARVHGTITIRVTWTAPELAGLARSQTLR